ncbi:YdcF family protein [Pelagibacteraceae bacterium]|nr:YdcF family protein [Pelagibacteraceae bacterium]
MSFYLSKIIWLILNPFNLFIFITLFSISLYFFNLRRLSLIIFLINFVFIAFISFLPIGSYLIYNIEKEYHSYIQPPEQVDGILILGGATNPILYNEYDQISLNGSSERLVESVFIIKKFDKAKVIFSGGSGIVNRPDFDHAQVAKSFYKKIGIEIDRIIFEDNSRNTYENIMYSKKIANPKLNENWLLITSASHMKRALLIADKNNWKLIPYAVDFKNIKDFKLIPNLKLLTNLNSFQHGSREWLGLVSYYLMGRTDKIF